MDATLDLLVEWARQTWRAPMGPALLDQARMRLGDAVGCMVGGAAGPSTSTVRAWARPVSPTGAPPADPPIEAEVLALTVALNYWDASDVYALAGAGHPSDVVPVALAAAAGEGLPLEVVLRAIAVGYELFGALNETFLPRDAGWDQGAYVAVTAAVVCGLVYGLSTKALAHAVAIAVVSNAPLRQSRAGELSMWKSVATGWAASNGVFAARMARLGMTGPAQPFEGRHGFVEQLAGRFPLADHLVPGSQPSRIGLANTKLFPAEHHAQAAIEAACELHGLIVGGEPPRAITVHTHRYAVSEILDDPAKWQPANKETADHSLVYLVAAALADGNVSYETFDEAALGRRDLREIIDRMEVVEDPELTAALPSRSGARVSATTSSGVVVSSGVPVATGNWEKPAERHHLEEKFARLTSVIPRARFSGLLERCLSAPLDEKAGHLLGELRSLVPPTGN